VPDEKPAISAANTTSAPRRPSERSGGNARPQLKGRWSFALRRRDDREPGKRIGSPFLQGFARRELDLFARDACCRPDSCRRRESRRRPMARVIRAAARADRDVHELQRRALELGTAASTACTLSSGRRSSSPDRHGADRARPRSQRGAPAAPATLRHRSARGSNRGSHCAGAVRLARTWVKSRTAMIKKASMRCLGRPPRAP
jgi:hypothetical protein